MNAILLFFFVGVSCHATERQTEHAQKIKEAMEREQEEE